MSEPTVTYTEGETIDYAEIVVSQRALDDWRAGCIVPGVESDYEFRVSGGTLAECLAHLSEALAKWHWDCELPKE